MRMSSRPGPAGALAAAIGLLLLLAPPASAAKTRLYKGAAINPQGGSNEGQQVIKTKKRGRGRLKVVAKCKNGACRGFPKIKARVERDPEDRYRYTGSFSLDGNPCTLDAYIYKYGFHGTYGCDDGRFGSVDGSRGGGGRGD